jgi:hypothetical protein
MFLRARFVYGSFYLVPLGKTAEAIKQSRLALQSAPLSLLFHSGMMWCLICAGQHRESIACGCRAMEIDPNFHLTWHHNGRGCLAAAWRLAGDHERGAELALQFPRPDGLDLGHAI